MAKKQLDVTAIANELQHSAFFPGAQAASTPPLVAPKDEEPTAMPAQVNTPPAAPDQTGARPPAALPQTSPADPYARPLETDTESASTTPPSLQQEASTKAPVSALPDAFIPAQAVERPAARELVRTPVRPRTITRYAFEFYQDQVDNLRRYSLEEKMRGEKGSMSQMVRDAVDAYLAQRTHAEEER